MQRAAALALLLAAAHAAAAAAPLASGAPAVARRLLGLAAEPLLAGTNVQRTNTFVSYGNTLDSVVQNEAQAQAQAGATSSVLSVVADSIKAGQVNSDTRQAAMAGAAQAAIQQAASGANSQGAGAAARQNQGLVGYAAFGQGLSLRPDTRAALASSDAQRAIQSNIGDAAGATAAATNSAEAATWGTRSHEWTN